MLEVLVVDELRTPLGFLRVNRGPTRKGEILTMSPPAMSWEADAPIEYVHLVWLDVHSRRPWDSKPIEGHILQAVGDDARRLFLFPEPRFVSLAERFSPEKEASAIRSQGSV